MRDAVGVPLEIVLAVQQGRGVDGGSEPAQDEGLGDESEVLSPKR